MKTKIPAFDFVRTVSTFAIVFFHFAVASSVPFAIESRAGIDNGWGFVFVTVFFALSGALLYYNHADGVNVIRFYRARIRTIYPEFYLVFLPLYLIRAVRFGTPFYRSRRWTLILSVLGLDGYLSDTFDTYYLVGEWFLGAIILLYLLYPVVLQIFRRLPLMTFTAGVLLYLLTLEERLWSISPMTNLFSCLVSFLFGMLFTRFCLLRKGLTSKILRYLLILLLGAEFIPVAIPGEVVCHLIGFGMFAFLFETGGIVTGNKWLADAFRSLSAVSFGMFLVHHVLIDKTIKMIDPVDDLPAIGLYLCILVLSGLLAGIVHRTAGLLLQQRRR